MATTGETFICNSVYHLRVVGGRIADGGYVRRMLRMELPGWRIGRSKRVFMDAVREDMQVVGEIEEEVKGRDTCKRVSNCGGL